MTYPRPHHRRSIRLKDFDYRQPAAYFVTLVTHRRIEYFGNIVSGQMNGNPAGKIVETCWRSLDQRFPNIILDEFIVMPNHIHGVIVISESANLPENLEIATQRPSLGEILAAYKSITTQEIIIAVHKGEVPAFAGKLWQRNYYEHVVRNDVALNQIRQYICDNPLGWDKDSENPRL